jgi:hypothetical protein
MMASGRMSKGGGNRARGWEAVRGNANTRWAVITFAVMFSGYAVAGFVAIAPYDLYNLLAVALLVTGVFGLSALYMWLYCIGLLHNTMDAVRDLAANHDGRPASEGESQSMLQAIEGRLTPHPQYLTVALALLAVYIAVGVLLVALE